MRKRDLIGDAVGAFCVVIFIPGAFLFLALIWG